MEQYDFSKETMSLIIDKLKEVCNDTTVIIDNFFETECIFDTNDTCDSDNSCVECTKFKLKAFLEIVKDVFVNGVPLIQVTNQEPKEKELHKCRLYSAYGETLDWIEITDEQLRLMEYLQDNDLLGDEIEFEECEAPNFKKI